MRNADPEFEELPRRRDKRLCLHESGNEREEQITAKGCAGDVHGRLRRSAVQGSVEIRERQLPRAGQRFYLEMDPAAGRTG